MNPLLQVKEQGQQVWLDNLSRTLLNDGLLERMVRDDGITGITTNPAIFHKAIADGRYYENDLAALREESIDAEGRYEGLVIPDVQRACDLLRPTYDNSFGDAGYVSLEVSPTLAHDTEGTVTAGLRLSAAVARPNLLIKVPATAAGVHAVERLIAHGISVNVTLMFSLSQVDAVASAYERGIRALTVGGGDARRVMSVASLFLSRVDTLVDKRLDDIGGDALELRGHTAVALARLSYQRYLDRFHGAGFAEARAHGARPQYMLWASTSTKNPAYDDLLYVEPLIGPETVNTLPDATLVALRDHGKVACNIDRNVDLARAQFAALAAHGVDMEAVGAQLQEEGLQQFEVAFAEMLKLTA